MVIDFVKVKIKIVSFTTRHGVSNNIPITLSLLKIIREFMKERIERYMRNQLVTSEIQNTKAVARKCFLINDFAGWRLRATISVNIDNIVPSPF